MTEEKTHMIKCTCGKEMEYSEYCNLWYCKDCTIKRWKVIANGLGKQM